MLQDTGGIKSYLRRKFSTGGGGITFGGFVYAAGETGIKAFADAVFVTASDEIVITQHGFEGGYSTGQIRLSKLSLLSIIEELITELGFGSDTGARQLMIFADWSEGLATT